MQGKQNQWLQTLNLPRQETVSKQIMQLEGSSEWSATLVFSVDFRLFLERDIAFLFTIFSFSIWRSFLRSKMAGYLPTESKLFIGWYFLPSLQPIISVIVEERESLERDAFDITRWLSKSLLL